MVWMNWDIRFNAGLSALCLLICIAYYSRELLCVFSVWMLILYIARTQHVHRVSRYRRIRTWHNSHHQPPVAQTRHNGYLRRRYHRPVHISILEEHHNKSPTAAVAALGM